MKDGFLELKSTENQAVYLRRSSINAFEVVAASKREEGHIKIYVSGFKFLVKIEKDDLIKQLNG